MTRFVADRRMRGFVFLLLTALALGAHSVAVAAEPVTSPVEAKAPQSRAVLRALMKEHIRNLKTATWSGDVWLLNGTEEQHTITKVYWSADGRVRVDVVDKDNKGATAVLIGDTVTGFRRGMLSFAKMSFDFNHKMVKSVRGQTMKSTGFVDDFTAFIEQDEARVESMSKTEAIINFADAAGLPARMWIRLPELHPYKMEVREGTKVVEKHFFTDIEYQADLPADVFNP